MGKEKFPKVSRLDTWIDDSTTYRERERGRGPGLRREDLEFNILDVAMNYGDLLLQSPRVRRKAGRRRKFYLDISSELNQLLL